MKTTHKFAAILSLLVFVLLIAHAITLDLPEIPPASSSATEAIKKMENYLADRISEHDIGMVLIAVEWCRSDQFQPRLSDGKQWHVTRGKDEWSWFFTYAIRSKNLKTFSGVRIMRIRDSGEIDGLDSTRT